MQVRRLVPVLAAVVFAVAAPLAAGAAASSSSPISQPSGTIAGTVTGQDGAPIAHACVAIYGKLNPPTAFTAADGTYSVSGLTPSGNDSDTYGIYIDAGCGTDPLSPDYLPFQANALVHADETTTLNAVLSLGGSLAGQVTNADGTPLAGVCVNLVEPAGGYLVGQSATTDSDGRYILKAVSPGSYATEYWDCRGTANVQAQYSDNAQDFNQATKFDVTAGETTELPQQFLSPGGEIDLSVTDGDGNPIPGLHPVVTLAYASSGLPFSGRASVAADSSGVYHYTDLLSQPYIIGYYYCEPGAECRPGALGYYPYSGPGGSPEFVWPASGQATAVTDVIDSIPPLHTSTITVASTDVTIPDGGPFPSIQAHVSDDSGVVPTGIVDVTEGVNFVGYSSLDWNGDAEIPLGGFSVGTHVLDVRYSGDGESTPSDTQVTVHMLPPVTTPPGGGGGGGGGVPPAPAPVSGSVPAGGSLSSDPAGTTPDASNPLVVGVTSPNGGTVSIDKTAPDTQLSHYRILNVGATITAPAASATNPLKLSFQVFDGSLPDGAYASDLTVFRDGAPVATCAKPGVVSPDPCVTSSTTLNGVTTITVLSSHASTWDVEAAQVGRIAGADRVATAAAVALDSFPNGGAGAVVLARADDFPDALVGAPLAAAKNAPLLLTQGAALPKATADALVKVLAKGSTVYVLGGSKAVPDTVATQLSALGYQVVRYAGADRYATAVAVADALGDPGTVLLATGANFPDALAAGPAAAHLHGAVLLTDGDLLPAATSAYLAAHAGTVYAVGGPAAKADSTATTIVGADRYATAAQLASRFFGAPTLVGVATGTGFPDALSGGAQLAHADAPLLLATPTGVPGPTSDYLASVKSGLNAVHLFGGPNALSDNVNTQLKNAV